MAISSTTGPLSSPGIGSGLDINGIVSKLMSIEAQPLTALATSEAGLQSRISAYGTLKGGLASLQSALSGLKDAKSLRALSATLADASIATATTGSGAVAGSYSLEVSQLAQAHKVASAGFASTTDAVGSGSLTFAFGTFDGVGFTLNGTTASRTVTIGPGQNTLAGIRDAVNVANIGVTATIINDGSAAGNRLVFTSNASGAANSLKITVADADASNLDNAGLSQLAYDPAAAVGAGRNLTQKVAAQNALLTLDGISVSKASNVVTDAIEGVTLNLLKTNAGAPTRLTVATDSSSTTSAVQAFVKAYNDLSASIDSLTKYNPDTRTASILTGDSATRSIQGELRKILGGVLEGVGGNLNTLRQAGISIAAGGTLTLDTAKLSAVVAADPASVARLFAAIGTASDSLVAVNATGAKLLPGTYALTVSQLATQGSAVGSAPAALTITAGVNDQLDVIVDGASATVTLSAATYGSAAALAAEVQAKVNGAAALTQIGASVKVTESGGTLTLTSNRYGSASTVAIGGSGAAGLFGVAPAITAGVDVAGTIGGAAAVGTGRVLSGATGSAVEGVQLEISGGSTGARGDLTYTQGFAAQLDLALTRMLDATGVVATRTDGVTKRIADIGHRRDELTLRLQQVEANYRKQFQALDALLSSMTATSNFLTQQLANLPKISQN